VLGVFGVGGGIASSLRAESRMGTTLYIDI